MKDESEHSAFLLPSLGSDLISGFPLRHLCVLCASVVNLFE